MLSFTPPIKASLLITLVYMICFQLYIQTGNYAWLYPANVFCIVSSVLYVRFLNRTNAKLTMPMLTAKGTRISFISSLLCLAGVFMMFLINAYLLPGANHLNQLPGSIKATLALVFANSFLMNFVCGSLAAFITAGFMNEKSYTVSPKHLPSVKR